MRHGLSIGDEPGGHTRALLALTESEFRFRTGEFNAGICWFITAKNRAPKITTDPKQQARVYRGIGRIERKYLHHYASGISWGIRACLVRGIPLVVRGKSFWALFGGE